MILVNQLTATSLRLVTPWTGVWFADADVTLDESGIVPFGPCAITIGTSVYIGTIDERASGAFGGRAQLRILGGGGGWYKSVRAQHFHNDAGVLSTLVYSATAAEVREVLVDVVPSRLGIDYVRTAGPASRVLAGLEWYVNPQGITTVGPRLPLPLDPTSAEILSWDPLTRTAEISSDLPIAPGTILLDPSRFSGALKVRDVEQTWGADGSRATVWVADESGSRLQAALTALVEEKIGVVYLRTYRYRVVLENADGRLILQAVSRTDGVPDVLPIAPWFGVPGVKAKLLPGSIVLVEFVGDDPTRPVVRGFDDSTPIQVSIDAATFVQLGGELAVRPVIAAGDLAGGMWPCAPTQVKVTVP